MTENKKKIEALLFSSGKAMSVSDLASLTNLKEKEVNAALNDLKKDYDGRDSSLMLMQEGDSWKLNIRENYVSLVTKIIADTELSKTVVETLGVIAWKAPVLQSEIIKIRSSQAYEHISELSDLGFVRKEKEGRSYLLRLTEKFFEYFNVPGEKAIKEALKEVKMPEKKNKEKFGVLEVVPINDSKPKKEESPLESAKKAIEKKFEVIDEPEPKEEPIMDDREFLDRIDKNIEDIAKKNDELDEDELFKRKPETQPEGEQAESQDSNQPKQRYFSPEELLKEDNKDNSKNNNSLESEEQESNDEKSDDLSEDEDLEEEKDKNASG